MAVTTLRFAGGQVLKVDLSLEKVQRLVEQAIEDGRPLLVLQTQHGWKVIVNPCEIQYFHSSSAPS